MVWPILLGLMGSAAGGAAGGAAAGGAAGGGAMGGLGGLLGGGMGGGQVVGPMSTANSGPMGGGGGGGGMLGGLLGKDGKASKWKDAAGNAASTPGEPGMPLQTGHANHMHAPDVSMVGQSLLFKLANQASQGAGPGKKRKLAADFMGLLGGW